MFIIIWSGLIVWLPPIIEVVSDLSKCSFHIKVEKVNKIFVPSNLLIRFKTLFFILFYLFNFIHIHLKHEQLNILQTHILLVSLWSVFSQFILVLADAFFSTAHDFERQFTTAKQNIFMEENFNLNNSIILCIPIWISNIFTVFWHFFDDFNNFFISLGHLSHKTNRVFHWKHSIVDLKRQKK